MQRAKQLVGVRNHVDLKLTLHHMTGPELVRAGYLKQEQLDGYFKFTVIREPFERMTSDFRWQQEHDSGDEFGQMDFAAYMDKAEQVIREGRYYERLHYDHFRPMTDYCIQQGELLLNDILKLEDLATGLARIRQHTGPLTDVKIVPARRYEDLRTPENLKRVYELYASDKFLYDNLDALLNSPGEPPRVIDND